MPVNKADLYGNGTTGLMWAAIKNKTEVRRLLLQKGADVNKQNV